MISAGPTAKDRWLFLHLLWLGEDFARTQLCGCHVCQTGAYAYQGA